MSFVSGRERSLPKLTYEMWYAELDRLGVFDIFKFRPECPECGDKPKSSGINWVCRTCGKSWRKKRRSEIVDYSTRPICPSCGSEKTLSNGKVRWICSVCGKQWAKNIRDTSSIYRGIEVC